LFRHPSLRTLWGKTVSLDAFFPEGWENGSEERLTGPIVLETARGVRTYKMSYWNAQIWASATLHQIPVIFSEDFNEGTVVEGISF
jgi:predicted nucleic acid-binding protein